MTGIDAISLVDVFFGAFKLCSIVIATALGLAIPLGATVLLGWFTVQRVCAWWVKQ